MWYNTRMKSRLLSLAVLLSATVAAMCGAAVPCRVLRPDASALAQRVALLQESQASSPLMRASMRADTRQVEIDVLVAYDLSAQRWLSSNGKGTPFAYAQRKVDEMNVCLSNSRIGEFRFRLVGTVSISEDASQVRDYWGFVNLVSLLASLVNDEGRVVAHGEWAKITDARETLGADIVSVLVDAGYYGNIGVGFSLEDGWGRSFSQDPTLIPAFGDWAYSVCSIPVADEGQSMLHEIGHNMGCGHPDGSCASSYAMDLGPQLFPYSAGYYMWIGSEGYYTIMGYNFGGLRVDKSFDLNDRFTELPYFSSPSLTYNGVALGTDANDNRRTLLETYAYVAQYRAAKLASGTDPVALDSTPSRVFQTEFNPDKAYNGVAPYVGAAYSGDRPVAIVRLRCAKAATRGIRAGTSRVSAAVTGLDGKQKRSSTAYVVCDYDATTSLTVTDWGALSLTLGGEGFVGSLGDGLAVKTATVGGDWPHARAFVDVDFGAGTGTLPSGTLTDLLPTGDRAEPFTLVNGKWKFAAAAAVKYAKTRNPETREESYVLQGLSDPQKTNRSAMRLTYDSRKGTFKGSFKVYVLETSGTVPRLKKHTARVSGIVVGGLGYGQAEIKQVGTFPVSIRL